jgi:prevent-host-death family protein
MYYTWNMAIHVVPVRELNQNTSAMIARVQTGEELLISVSGRPVARLVPLEPEQALLNRLVAEGRATAPTDDGPFAMPARTGDPTLSVSDAIAAARADERW